MSINAYAMATLSPERTTDGRWAYFDDATRRYWVVTEDDLAELSGPDQYDSWCASTLAVEMPANWKPGAAVPFDLLDGVMTSDNRDDLLDSVDDVIGYAEAAGQQIHYSQAERLISVGKHWLKAQTNGNGEWDRMRREAREFCEL